MNDLQKLAIPKKERLEVQLIDGTEEHNVKYVITSLAKVTISLRISDCTQLATMGD